MPQHKEVRYVKKFRFKKSERLRYRKEILYVLKKGKRIENEKLILFFSYNKRDYSRIAISTKKRIGNAVKRNKVKRLIKEFFRNNKKLFGKGLDWLIIPKCSEIYKIDNVLNNTLIELINQGKR